MEKILFFLNKNKEAIKTCEFLFLKDKNIMQVSTRSSLRMFWNFMARVSLVLSNRCNCLHMFSKIVFWKNSENTEQNRRICSLSFEKLRIAIMQNHYGHLSLT